MARASLLTVLLVGLCLAGQALGSDQQRRRSQSSMEIERDFPQQGQKQPQPFQPNQEYSFTFNGQIATGLQQDTATGGESAQQKSATRIQSQAIIHFHSERHATLRLQQIRLGQLNEIISSPQQVQPMGMFEQKRIDGDKLRELQLPCAFTYEEGVVARVNFHPEDATWSKNIKRSVLNLIQLNLKHNNAQGLRVEGQVGQQALSVEQQGQGQGQQAQGQSTQFTKVFTIPEITIEGECQTTYTINNANRQGRQGSSESNQASNEQQNQEWAPHAVSCPTCFNVTKSINFKQCSKIADVAYGFQRQQQQPQCAQCQQQWARQQQQSQNLPPYLLEQNQQQPGPCDQCDPKEVKENKLERTTVQRFVLSGKPEGKYSIKRAELVSQYIYKNLRAEGGQYGATMHAVVAAELVFRGSKQQSPQEENQQVKQLQQVKASTERDETILFSNNWDTEEKRFYMYGDEEFPRNSPFVKFVNKVEQAQGIIRKLITAISNKATGIEVEEVVQIQRLAELLRMCSVNELKEIQSSLLSQQQQNGAEQQKLQHILGDALAIAGTRNTIDVLVNQILEHQLSPNKAAQCLKALNGLPAPSDAQAAIVHRLCKSELVNRNSALKQSCWLTYGSIIGELCQHKTQKNAQQTPFGSQSGFNKDEVCANHKKIIYLQQLTERYEQARSTYEKVLALKALGNAGIDTAVPQLERIIKDKRVDRVVRIQCIDALRRLRTLMPRKLQRVLLPIFLNTREHPSVRMAAFSMIMQTQPEQPIVDQLAYALTKERSNQVLSFVYSTMKTLSKSKVPCQQQLAKHLKNALKLANIDEASLRGGSRKYQLPVYSPEEKEGLFLTLTSVVSSRDSLPSHLAINLDTLINGEFEMNNVKVGMTQQGLEQWYEKIMQQLLQQVQQYARQQPTRGQRSGQQGQQGSEQLQQLFRTLGIKSRQGQGFSSIEQTGNSQNQNQDEQPFGMINVRVGDVDQCVLAIDQQSLPTFIRQMLNGQKPSIRNLMESLEQPKHFRLLTAMNVNEKSAKIATSLGVSLRVLSAFPILAGVEGELKVAEGNGDRLESNGSPKLHLNIHPSIAVGHIQRMETWLPAIVTGVESVRCVEANIPLVAEASMSRQKGIEVACKLQGQKTRIFGLHTLPVTYHREYDSKSKTHKSPRVKNIHNEELEQLQREVQKTVGHTMGLPIRIQGHYHTPANPTYKELVQIMLATENQVHITYEPTQGEQQRSVRLTATGSAFENVDSGSFDSHRPALKDFYSQSVKFEQAYPGDHDEMQLEDHNQRREKLNTFISSYQPSAMYKHQLKLTAECVGGAQPMKAQVELEGACDAKLKYCKLFTTIDRSPMSAEYKQWQLKSKLQILNPDVVSNVQQLSQVEKKQQKFICQSETQWGTVDEKKQFVNIRLQGEKVSKPQWEQKHMMQQRGGSNEQQQKSYKKKSAFLNKFDAVVEYKLQPEMQSACSRAFETMKLNYFWNTETQLNLNQQNQNEQRSSSEGQVYATIVIDPISQKHANISIKTPTQAVRIQQVQLPTQIRPFPLVRQQSEQSTHSVGQMFRRIGGASGRAECKVDGNRVSTFDNVFYSAPISKCYTVLAKDCSNDQQPQFSVLMKALGSQQQQQGSQQQAKKLKVITPNEVIECQPKNPSNQQSIEDQPLKCTINGREVQGQSNERQTQPASFEDTDADVQYDNQDKTSCTINVPGVQVRFNGAKAWIKISNAYKNGQCGLCGHYNDDQEDEWRMPNNERASSLDAFHRSYAVQNNEECSAQEHEQFYTQNKGKFVQSSEEFRGQKWGNNQQRDNGYQSAFSDEYSSYDDESDEQGSWWGQQKNQRRSQWNRQQGNGMKVGGSGSNSQETVEPIKKTKMIEYSGVICFSTQPVKQCPEGTSPAGNQNEQQEPITSDYSPEQQQGDRQQQQQGQGQGNNKKISFACLPRSSNDARRLQRQARQGQVVDVSSLTANFAETVKQPHQCVRY